MYENPRSEGNDAITSRLMVDIPLNVFQRFSGAWDLGHFVRLWIIARYLENRQRFVNSAPYVAVHGLIVI